MREGSTLLTELIDDVRGIELEQPLALPRNSRSDTMFDMLYLVGITAGFAVTAENVANTVFLMIITMRQTRYFLMMLGCLFLHRNVPPLILWFVAQGLLLYLAVLFTRHWVHLRTTDLYPHVARQVRARFRKPILLSIVLLPLTLILGAMQVGVYADTAFRAWESFLQYGKQGERIPGMFHSPAGSRNFRRLLFFAVGTLITLSFGATPLPGGVAPTPMLIAILSAYPFIPAFLTIAVPSLVLMSHLWRLNRATNFP
jgi:hypothetical protein